MARPSYNFDVAMATSKNMDTWLAGLHMLCSYFIFNYLFFKVAHFITNKIEPKACTCGKAVAFNLPSMMKAITLKNPNNTLSDSAIRTYIVEERIGCVGKSTKFVKGGNSTSSAHVSGAWIPPEILEQLDRGTMH